MTTCANPNCKYQWQSRKENPKACPRCKTRLDKTINYQIKPQETTQTQTTPEKQPEPNHENYNIIVKKKEA